MTKTNEIFSIEAEQAVLCCFIKYRGCYLKNSDRISSEDFINETHRIIFESLAKYFISKKNHDLIEITSTLVGLQKINVSYISSLCGTTASEQNIDIYIKIVKDRSVRRNIIESFNQLSTSVIDIEKDINEVCSEVEESIYKVSSLNPKKIKTLVEIIAQFYDELEEAQKNKGDVVGIKSGFYHLDKKTQGFRKKSLVVIAGRPGMGKTSFALNMLENFVFREKKCVMFFSLEMAEIELIKRIISSQCSIDQYNLNSGKINESQLSVVSGITAKIVNHEKQILIEDDPNLTPSSLRAKIRRQSLDTPPEVIIIDYLQLMSSGKRFGNTTEEITEISRELKKIAKEFNVPVIALSQLNRNVENRLTEKMPQLSDLRGSGSIEQDADQVIFVHRSEKDNPDSHRYNEADIILSKNRHGEIGHIILKFVPKITKFQNMEAISYEDY